jgi:hypothetical protein
LKVGEQWGLPRRLGITSDAYCPVHLLHDHADGVHQPRIDLGAGHTLEGVEASEGLQVCHEEIQALHQSDATIHATPASAHCGSYVVRVGGRRTVSRLEYPQTFYTDLNGLICKTKVTV